MGLTNHKEEQLKSQPIIRSRVWKSQNGQHVVFQTTITEIKPVPYMEKVMSGEQEEGEEQFEALAA